jgi:hypothetical protein
MISDVPDMTVTIDLQDDNSVRLEWSPVASSSSESSEEKSSKIGVSSYVIKDIINVNSDPFYIEIHDPTDSTKIAFSTKLSSTLFTNDFTMFSTFFPLSNSERFFGIGERKGNFWLDDNYQYSLFTNNHDLSDIVQAGGKTVQFSKNGFFPIIYSQLTSSLDSLMGVWLSEGSKDIFFTKKFAIGGKINPKISVVQEVNHIDMTIYYDQQAIRLF